MKKLVLMILAGVGLVAFARRSVRNGNRQDKGVPTLPTPPATGKSIDPGIVVQSPFNGDPGIVVGPAASVPRKAASPTSTPASRSGRPAADQHDVV